MKQHSFERNNDDRWSKFDELLGSVKQGYKLSDSSRSNEFIHLYQQITRDLALAKARGYSRNLISRLNTLVRAGHNVIYVKRSGMWRSVLAFAFAGFPTLVRSEWRYLAVSTLLFVVPLVGVGVMTYVAPDTIYSVMSEDQVSSVENMYDPSLRSLGRERQSDSDFYMFGFYIMNNISISFQVFATGILFGLGTVFYLVFNGVHIGAVSGHLLMLGFDETFLPFIVGHGAFELTAIVIAGAAGLLIGHALIAPGKLPRLKSLAIKSRVAIELVMGAAVMLLFAAFLEAFWSSSTVLPNLVKYFGGAIFWLFVILYFVFAGRNRES